MTKENFCKGVKNLEHQVYLTYIKLIRDALMSSQNKCMEFTNANNNKLNLKKLYIDEGDYIIVEKKCLNYKGNYLLIQDIIDTFDLCEVKEIAHLIMERKEVSYKFFQYECGTIEPMAESVHLKSFELAKEAMMKYINKLASTSMTNESFHANNENRPMDFCFRITQDNKSTFNVRIGDKKYLFLIAEIA